MATILIISETAATSKNVASVHVDIGGSEYLVLFGRQSVTVLTGRWIRDRRAIGKTFWSIADLQAAYRKHGQVLAEIVSKRWVA